MFAVLEEIETKVIGRKEVGFRVSVSFVLWISTWTRSFFHPCLLSTLLRFSLRKLESPLLLSFHLYSYRKLLQLPSLFELSK